MIPHIFQPAFFLISFFLFSNSLLLFLSSPIFLSFPIFYLFSLLISLSLIIFSFVLSFFLSSIFFLFLYNYFLTSLIFNSLSTLNSLLYLANYPCLLHPSFSSTIFLFYFLSCSFCLNNLFKI